MSGYISLVYEKKVPVAIWCDGRGQKTRHKIAQKDSKFIHTLKYTTAAVKDRKIFG